jgi:hypothetical protein
MADFLGVICGLGSFDNPSARHVLEVRGNQGWPVFESQTRFERDISSFYIIICVFASLYHRGSLQVISILALRCIFNDMGKWLAAYWLSGVTVFLRDFPV